MLKQIGQIYMLRICTILLISFLTSHLVYGQVVSLDQLDKKTRNLYDKAIAEGRKKAYQKSLKNFKKVLDKYPDFIDGRLRAGGMYYNLKDYESSAEQFKMAIQLDPEYDPLMYYSLAIVFQDAEQYQKAAEQFQSFLNRVSEGKRAEKAKQYRTSCLVKDSLIRHAVPFDPILLPSTINSDFSEYQPATNLEENMLIFTRRVRGQEDFYITYKNDSVWYEAVPLEQLNTPQNEGVHTLSADGKTLIFTACDRRVTGHGSCDLYISRKKGNTWGPPANMGPIINSIAWDAQPTLTSDGKTMYFSSNRKGSTGGRDLWVTHWTRGSGWSIPVTLPSTINSPGEEESPFIHPDGHTLYFRSNGRNGMGGFDIFYSRYIDSLNTWTEAQNIGYPINTAGSEGGLTVSLDGFTAYMASDMAYLDGNQKPHLDIYYFDLYEEARPLPTTFIKIKTINAFTGKPLTASIRMEVENDSSLKSLVGYTDESGTYINSLPSGYEYAIYAEKEQYHLYSDYITLKNNQSQLNPIVIEIALQPITFQEKDSTKVRTPIVLNNIFFESGSAQLLDKSNREIKKLADHMKMYPDYRIQILGHTDNIGQADDNLKLSLERAKAVRQALISNEIAPQRIEARGMGETNPIANNETEDGRKKNRRTEFIIID